MSNKPNAKLFENSQVGRIAFKPLHHKNGDIYTDLEYMELLGRKCIELDRQNTSTTLPTDYGGYDLDVVRVAKGICEAMDNGVSKKDLQKYLSMCIDTDH